MEVSVENKERITGWKKKNGIMGKKKKKERKDQRVDKAEKNSG